jgi:hypothetical protein
MEVQRTRTSRLGQNGQSSRIPLQGVRAPVVQRQDNIDLSGFSETQLQLFRTVVRLVDQVKNEGASDITKARASSDADLAKLVTDLRRQLQIARGNAEVYRKAYELLENGFRYLWEKEVEDLDRAYTKATTKADFMREMGKDAHRNSKFCCDTLGRLKTILTMVEDDASKETLSPGTQMDNARAAEVEERANTRTIDSLQEKYNILFTNHSQLLVARKELEKKLRATKDNEKKWMTYGVALGEETVQLKALLERHGISVGLSNGDKPNPLPPPPLISATSSFCEAPTAIAETAPHTVTLELVTQPLSVIPGGQARVEALDRKLQAIGRNVNAQETTSIIPQPLEMSVEESNGPERRAGRQRSAGAVNDVELPVLPITAEATLIAPRTSPADLGGVIIPRLRHSSPTQGTPLSDPPNLPNIPEVHAPASEIYVKQEPSSDTPVIISTRSVRKRKRGESTTTKTVKVKMELHSSSPLAIAALQHALLPQESMDLDDIGEKVNTPKKRGTPLPDSKYEPPSSPIRGRSHSILQPTSPNKRLTPRSSRVEQKPMQSKTLKRSRMQDRMRGAAIFAEDTDNEDPITEQGGVSAAGGTPSTRSPTKLGRARNRLIDLLEKPSSRPTTPTPHRDVRVLRQSDVPTIPDGPQAGSSARGTRTAARKSRLNTPDVPSSELRGFSPSKLRLSDFKVNPSFNQGLDYAFADVVRGREQRKCLPGCTRPECCGTKFRRIVEFNELNRDQITSSQEAADRKLLEDYLGDNAYKIRSMSAEERRELLMQAKTRELAQKAGRHKSAYERRRSPPGFWRTDFPSTQELAKDRQEADQRERELVRERYEEAMRRGGRWVFRDE